MTEKEKKPPTQDEFFASALWALHYHQPNQAWENFHEVLKIRLSNYKRPPAALLKMKDIIAARIDASKLQNYLNKDVQNYATIELPCRPLSELQISEVEGQAISEIIEEYRNKHVFPATLPIRNRFLFGGPPGTGKTMAARVIATELGLPLVVVSMPQLIRSYLGESSRNLDNLFKQMLSLKAVYLFDEIDAFGAARNYGGSGASTENNRMVITLLTGLETINTSHSLFIGTTNFSDKLDRALLRRFNRVLVFKLPAVREMLNLLRQEIQRHTQTSHPLDFQPDDPVLHFLEGVVNCSELVEYAEEALRLFYLTNVPVIDSIRALLKTRLAETGAKEEAHVE